VKPGGIVAQGLMDDVITAANLSATFGQELRLDRADGRFWARRAAATVR
jgi:iron complex transport system ATP-binding protein